MVLVGVISMFVIIRASPFTNQHWLPKSMDHVSYNYVQEVQPHPARSHVQVQRNSNRSRSNTIRGRPPPIITV